MTDRVEGPKTLGEGATTGQIPDARRRPLPGVAAISFYLLLIAGTIVVGVVGGHYPTVYLLFSAAMITASGGLIVGFRWAWALGLATVFLLAAYWGWIFSGQHSAPAVVQGLLNFVFFLYLIRPEVRTEMK
ncbi:MAG TPA: hypothetical protein VGJ21_20855 [Terracidiphilus sp.]|jgi:hypothetical protein